MIPPLAQLSHLLEAASTLEALFGLPDSPDSLHSPTLLSLHVRERWRALLRPAHPDLFHNDPPAAELAHTLSALLNQRHDLAQSAIATGRYGLHLPLHAHEGPTPGATTLTTASHTYTLERALTRGELCTLYVARSPHHRHPLVIKLANSPSDNDLMRREHLAIARLFEREAPQHKHLPHLIETATLHGAHASILPLLHALDLPATLAALPQLSQVEHVIWITRRALSAIGWAHHQGVVHGNLCPEHLMIRPEDHNLWLVDWCYASVDPAKSGQRFACANDRFSAPEVFEGKPPRPASDLYSLGKIAQWLLRGGAHDGPLPADLPVELARFYDFLTRPSPLGRAQEAWPLYHTLEQIRRSLFGRHHFLPLRSPELDDVPHSSSSARLTP